jgi:hypothetical protein
MPSTNIDLIRFGFFRRNIVCALEFNQKKICQTTTTKINMLPVGVYDNGGAGFHDLTWFTAHDLRMDKWGKLYLLRILAAENITTITII